MKLIPGHIYCYRNSQGEEFLLRIYKQDNNGLVFKVRLGPGDIQEIKVSEKNMERYRHLGKFRAVTKQETAKALLAGL